MSPELYDAVVVGGGCAGAAAAITLAREGRRVLLVEQSGDATFKIGEALPPAARTLLEELEVWDCFTNDGHLPCYGNLSAWGSPDLRSSDFIFDPAGTGWHLDRQRFDMLLRNAALDAGAEVALGTKLNTKTCELSADSWLLSFSGNAATTLRSRWLIDATGRRSAVARACNEQRHADDALVAYFAVFNQPENSRATDQDSRTLIEAAPDGWWYTALLPSKARLLAYLTDADLAPPSLRTKPGYSSYLSQTTHVRACIVKNDYQFGTNVRAVSANSARLRSATGEGWIAVGDAALSFDPVSSQGILNALFTGIKAGHAISAKLSGNPDLLSDYDKQVAMIYNAYLQNRSGYYSLETRWPTHCFWRRRSESLRLIE